MQGYQVIGANIMGGEKMTYPADESVTTNASGGGDYFTSPDESDNTKWNSDVVNNKLGLPTANSTHTEGTSSISRCNNNYKIDSTNNISITSINNSQIKSLG